MAKDRKKTRVLAIASAGGHWVQLMRLRPAFNDCKVSYATVRDTYEVDVQGSPFYVFRDASRDNKLGMWIQAAMLLWIVIRVRPDFVISTGAAAGYFAIRIAKMFGSKTCWIDSIANAEEMSLSGRMVKRYADVWMTQWEHLSVPGGPEFNGSVIPSDSS
jgi:UDP-N-acetylglucosamine:LPS N-acetylglucosamine transferase